MPKLPVGMFKRKGRESWYLRLYRGGRERWVSLGTDFAAAVDMLRAGAIDFLERPVSDRRLRSAVRSQNRIRRRLAALQ